MAVPADGAGLLAGGRRREWGHRQGGPDCRRVGVRPIARLRSRRAVRTAPTRRVSGHGVFREPRSYLAPLGSLDRRFLGIVRGRRARFSADPAPQDARPGPLRGSRHHADRSPQTGRRRGRLRNQPVCCACMQSEGRRQPIRRRRAGDRDRSVRGVWRGRVLAAYRPCYGTPRRLSESRSVLQPNRGTTGPGVPGLHCATDHGMAAGAVSGRVRFSHGRLLQLLLRAESRHTRRRRQARRPACRRIRGRASQVAGNARRHRHVSGLDESTRSCAAGDGPSVFLFRPPSGNGSAEYRRAHHVPSVLEQLPLRQEHPAPSLLAWHGAGIRRPERHRAGELRPILANRSLRSRDRAQAATGSPDEATT